MKKTEIGQRLTTLQQTYIGVIKNVKAKDWKPTDGATHYIAKDKTKIEKMKYQICLLLQGDGLRMSNFILHYTRSTWLKMVI